MAFRHLGHGETIEHGVVVDNSVMMRWLFRDGSEEDQRYARLVLSCLKADSTPVVAPYLWVYEAAFVVHHYVRKGAISPETGADHLKGLFDLCTVVRGEETPVALMAFASEHGVSAYDASYVLLARAHRRPIATLDRNMLAAARRLGVTVFPD